VWARESRLPARPHPKSTIKINIMNQVIDQLLELDIHIRALEVTT
jgi:hypothetical protein